MLFRLQKILLWPALIGLSAASCWGIYSAHLLAQPLWAPMGLRRLALFSCAYALWCALVIGFSRRWFVPLTSFAALAWTVLSIGVKPVGAVALFLFSCLVLGRIILRESNPFLPAVLGMALFMTVIGAAIHFPINYPLAYLALFLAPLTNLRIAGRTLAECWDFFRPVERGSRPEYVAAALLGFVMLAQLLSSFKPETGPDGLGMHLFIPWSVYFKHYWGFDFQRISWALMPMGGDWCFTGVFLLGGESAVKLLNFGVLAILTGMVYWVVRHWLLRGPALVTTALFVSSPLAQLVTGSVFVENIQAAFLIGALVALWQYRERGSRPWLFTSAVLLGSGMATKFGSLAFAAPFVLFAAAEVWRWARRLKRNLSITALTASAAQPRYGQPRPSSNRESGASRRY